MARLAKEDYMELSIIVKQLRGKTQKEEGVHSIEAIAV